MNHSPRQLVEMMIEASRALDAAQRDLEERVRAEAHSEAEYRKARASAYLATSGTVGEREAHVDKAVATERYAAHLAEGLAKSALENVRSKRGQLSALQSIANALKEEAMFARTGPGP